MSFIQQRHMLKTQAFTHPALLLRRDNRQPQEVLEFPSDVDGIEPSQLLRVSIVRVVVLKYANTFRVTARNLDCNLVARQKDRIGWPDLNIDRVDFSSFDRLD